jgi:hypothetical protein
MTRLSNIMLTLSLALAGCSTYVAAIAPDAMVGMEMPDLIACAGIPDKEMITKPDVMVLEWTGAKSADGGSGVKTSGFSFSLPLGTSLTVAAPTDTCHMQATVLRDGTVADVDMVSSNGIKDANGACGQIVKQCAFHGSDTGLPKDYDAFHYFFPAADAKPADKPSAPGR